METQENRDTPCHPWATFYACHLTVFRLFLILALLAVPSWSQKKTSRPAPKDLTQMPIEDLMNVEVYSASKYLQKVTEAPSSVSIVTAEEIQLYGYRTLADVLKSLRGFFVTNDRNYSYLGARGFAPPGDYNGRVLLLVDGHRLNDNIFDGALLGTEFPVPVDQIERVEVIRGPTSSLYGTSAFFAVINVVTKARNSVNHVQMSFEAGSFGSYKGQFSYGTTLPRQVKAYIAGSIYRSYGHDRLYYSEFDTPATNNGFAINADDDSSSNFLANLAFRDFKLQAVYGSREKGIPTASYGTLFNDPHTRTIDGQGYVDLRFEHNFSKDWSLLSRISYDRYFYTGDYVYAAEEGGESPTVVNHDSSQGDWWTWEAQVKKRFGERNRLTGGIEVRGNLRQDQQNYDVSPYALYLDTAQDSSIWAGYIEDELKLHPMLTLNAGVRHDQYSSFGGTTNPRLGVIFRPVKKSTFKLLYGQAFRAPNAYELFYESPGDLKANPHLRPETIRTYEGVFDQYISDHFHFSLSLYQYRIRDLIVEQVDPADGLRFFQNAERIQARGVETEIEGKWPGGLQLRASYAFQQSKDQVTGLLLANSPKHLGKSNLSIPLAKQKLFFSVEAHYTSSRQTISANRVGGFATANVTFFGKQVAKGLDISASIYNLLDKTYADACGQEFLQDAIRQDGRSFRVKLTYSF